LDFSTRIDYISLLFSFLEHLNGEMLQEGIASHEEGRTKMSRKSGMTLINK
jgi:hypothetical protein